MMAIDILEKGEINTNRKGEQGLLLKIRNGGFQHEDRTLDKEFYGIVADYEERLKNAAEKSALPDNPDMEKIEFFVEYVNKRVIEGDY